MEVPRWFVGGLVLAVISAYIIGGYYRRQSGTVEARRFRTGGPSLLANVAVVFALAVLQDVRPAAARSIQAE